MSDDKEKRISGEAFLTELQQATSRGVLFAITENYVKSLYPQSDLLKLLNRMSDFDAVVIYQAKLARVRVEYNMKAIREIHQRLVGLKNFGEDNYKYKEKIIRKLNLLINNHPPAEDMLYMAMASYVEHGFGNVKDFKSDYEKWVLGENLIEKIPAGA